MKNNRMSPEKELELINRYSTAKLTPEQVFCFTVTLCDNEIDRDHERFTVETLKKISELFVGKTGISDHSMRSGDQRSRIFHTWLETDNTKKTSAGEAYTALKARAYMLRTSETASMISEIEGGIKKEVSISCSVNKTLCSICGEDFKSHSCKHIKGRKYNSQVCHAILSDPTDAYEWSFVAVPAQRNAGVTKSFKKEKSMENILKSIKEGKSLSLEGDGLKALSNYIEGLERKSADGEKYRADLCAKTKMSFSLAIPEISEECVDSILKNLSTENLEALLKAMSKKAATVAPIISQLYVEEGKNNNNSNSQFKF